MAKNKKKRPLLPSLRLGCRPRPLLSHPGVHHPPKQPGSKRGRQHEGRVARRQLGRVPRVAQAVEGALRVRVVVGVALQAEGDGVGGQRVGVPGVVGGDALGVGAGAEGKGGG